MTLSRLKMGGFDGEFECTVTVLGLGAFYVGGNSYLTSLVKKS